MKKVLSNNIATDIRQPYTKVTHEWYNSMITEAIEALGKGLVGTNSNFVVLYGCVNSASPNANISAGAIFYNGEIYLCPAFVDASITNAIVGTITTAYDSSDPILFSDGNSYDVHEVKTIVWSDAVSGSGDIDFSDLIVQKGTIKQVVNIGDWNMDSTASVSVTLPFGVVIDNVVSIQATIRNDAASSISMLNSVSGGVLQGGIQILSGATIQLERLTGGSFDNASFDSTGFNRGYVVIESAY